MLKMRFWSFDCFCLEIGLLWHLLLLGFTALFYLRAIYTTKCIAFLIVPVAHFITVLLFPVTAHSLSKLVVA